MAATKKVQRDRKAEAGKCLRDGCERDAVARGLCLSDYQTISRLVKNGQTSWNKLEKAGKVRESRRKRTPGATAWALS